MDLKLLKEKLEANSRATCEDEMPIFTTKESYFALRFCWGNGIVRSLVKIALLELGFKIVMRNDKWLKK